MRYPHTSQRGCPTCGAPLRRTRRRTLDRLFSVFARVQRYRCMRCQWAGLVKVDRSVVDAEPTAGGL